MHTLPHATGGNVVCSDGDRLEGVFAGNRAVRDYLQFMNVPPPPPMAWYRLTIETSC